MSSDCTWTCNEMEKFCGMLTLSGPAIFVGRKKMFLRGSSPKRNCLQLGRLEKVCMKKSRGFLHFFLEQQEDWNASC